MFHANVKTYVLNEYVMLNWCKVTCVKSIFKDVCIKRICKDVRIKCTCKYSKITAPKFADV